MFENVVVACFGVLVLGLCYGSHILSAGIGWQTANDWKWYDQVTLSFVTGCYCVGVRL